MPDRLEIPKGTTHLVSDEDFKAIVAWREPEPEQEEELIRYKVNHVLATRGGKELIVTRSFRMQKSADDFTAFLKTKNVKVV